MFSLLSYLQLQQLWWIIISLIGGLFVFLMFIQGGQSLIYCVATNDIERSMVINTFGRKWETGFTTLVLFGGACFAAFPLFYSVSFGGAYWVWLAILICFVIQAVSYEYRKKPNNFLGQKVFEIFLFINGVMGVFLLGVALSTLFSGAEFILDENKFVTWQTSTRGLEAFLVPANYLLAFSLVFLSRLLGAMYIIFTVESKSIEDLSYKIIRQESVIFLIFFLTFLGWILFKSGYSYDVTMHVSIRKYKYMENLMSMPLVAIELIAGVLLVLSGLVLSIFKRNRNAIWVAGFGTVLTAMSILLIAGLNGTPFYPSLSRIQDSLTIQNASSSEYTLTAMSYIALFVPFVLGYIIFAWWAMNKKKITAEEVRKHSY